MAGYSRQSAASIVPTAVVRATPLNDEFNTLRDAFVVATGHKHDGTSTEGAYVPLISDTNARNKVVVDSANNRISLFINVSSTAVEQLRLIDGAILPVTDNDIDLGSSTFEFKDLFIDGTANIDSLVADTAAISGGTINSTVIGGTTPAAGTFTTVSATVSATIPSATISGGTINNTIIGATTPAAGTFTNLTVNTAATIASAAISAGTINNTVIGGTTPQAVTGTTITANTGFVGALTGNVTGNVTASSGTSTFNNATVNGTLSATLTGNVNASSGTSTFNNVTISGTLNMDGATAATITNLSSPVNSTDAATKGYVDTSISNLIDTAPGTLDTLNELAAALGDDPNFATTVTNSIATKLSLSGGTMTGAIAMGTNKITGMGDPTSAQDAATKTYVDTQRDTRLALSGGTMSGAIAMGTNKITGLGDPTLNQDAATKIYVDGILGSATSAAASAAAAATSASNAATSASNASTSATNAASSASAAAASAAAAAASYDSFDDRYLGVKTSDPSLDNDGNALVTGAIYFNSSAGEMRVWTGSAWASTLLTTGAQTFTGVKTFASNPILDAGTANGVAYLNGSKVLTTGSALTFNGTTVGINTSVGNSTSLSITGDYTPSNTATFIAVQRLGGAVAGAWSYNDAQGAIQFGTTTNHSTIFLQNNAEAMRLTSTSLYTASGINVGIGTSNPQSKLHIDVDGTALRITRGSSIGFLYNTGTASTDITRLQSNSGSVQLYTSGGTATLDSSGNLGLGVTPSAWQSATIRPIEINRIGNFVGGNGSAAAVYLGANTRFESSSWRYANNGAAGLYTVEDNTHFWRIAPSWNGTGSDVISFTTAMTLDASGNLGVGTTSLGSFKFKASGTGGNLGGNAYFVGLFGDGSASNKGVGLGYDSSSQTGIVYAETASAASNLAFWTYSGTTWAERARITSGGDFGIGTSSPNGRLTLQNSSVRAEFGETGGANYIESLNNARTDSVPLRLYGLQLQVFTKPSLGGYSQNLTLDSSGNLGIGTSSPLGIFNIKTSNGQFLVQNGTSANQMRISAFNNAGNANAALIFEGYSSEYGRFDSSGNLGIGGVSSGKILSIQASDTTNAVNGQAGLQIINTNASAGGRMTTVTFGGRSSSNYPFAAIAGILVSDSAQEQSGDLAFYTKSTTTAANPTERARITSGGNLVVGTTTANRKFVIGGTAGSSIIAIQDDTTGYTTSDGFQLQLGVSSEMYLWNYENSFIALATNNTERARITSGGSFNIGTTSLGGDNLLNINNSSSTGYGISVYVNNDSSTTYRYFEGYSTSASTQRIVIYTNGDVRNSNNSYGALSDAKLKQDIVDAGSQWNDIKALRVRKYRFRDQPDSALHIGLIAQEAETVSPGLITEHQDEKRNENGSIELLDTTTKSLKYSVLYMKAIKALQEAMARIEQLEAKVAALEAK